MSNIKFILIATPCAILDYTVPITEPYIPVRSLY